MVKFRSFLYAFIVFILNSKNVLSADFFIEIPLFPKNVYVGQSFNMKLRIWDAVNAQNVRFLPLTWQNVDTFPEQNIQKLTHLTYNGRPYTVSEFNLRIVIKTVGKQLFPALCVARTVIERIEKISPTDPHQIIYENKEEERITCTDPFSIDVFGLPKGIFPAQKVDILTGLSAKEGSVAVGTALKRSFVLKAVGTLPAYLPDLKTPSLENVKVYEGQLTSNLDTSEKQIIAEVKRTTVYIPEKIGKMTLPALSFSWLDTQNNKLETTVFPAFEIMVVQGLEQPPLQTVKSKVVVPPPLLSDIFQTVWKKIVDWFYVNVGFVFNLLFLGIFCVLFILFVFISIKKLSYERKLKNNIFKACQANQFELLKNELIVWGQTKNKNVLSLSDVANLFEPSEIQTYLNQLNALLYNENTDKNDVLGQHIESCFKKARLVRSKKKKTPALPELYP